MLERFEVDKKYKFSAEEYKKAEGDDSFKKNESWIKYCEDKEVEIIDETNAMCGCFFIYPGWCKEIKEEI